MLSRTLAVVCAVSFLLSSGLAHAQATGDADFVSFSSLTQEQQTSLTQAANFLTTVGGEDLSGITLCGADTHGQGIGASTPTTIGVDFKGLEQIVPPGTPGAPGYPGLVMIVMFHELQHLHHGWGRGYCDEIGIQLYTAQKQCEFIQYLVSEGYGPIDAQCEFYAFIQSRINSPATQAAIQEHGCTSPTGSTTVLPCANCP